MNKYEIYQSDLGFSCTCKNEDTSTMTSNTSEIIEIIERIINKPYVVKFDEENLIISSDDDTLTIYNYIQVLKNSAFSQIASQIDEHMSKYGYVNKSAARNVQKTPNYSKSKSTLKRAIAGFLILTSLIGAHAAYKLNKDLEQQEENDLRFQMEQVQVIDMKDYESQVQDIVSSNIIVVESIEESEKIKICKEIGRSLGIDPSLLLSLFNKGSLPSNTWINKELTYYKLDENTGDFIEDSLLINRDTLSKREYSILARAVIIQNSLLRRNNNLPASLQEYNIGTSSMDEILSYYSQVSGETLEAIISNSDDLGWIDIVESEGLDSDFVKRIFKNIDESSLTMIDVTTNTEYTYTDNLLLSSKAIK